MAVLTGVFTKKAITRIAHAAFQSAMERRKKVTWLGTLFEYVPRSGGTLKWMIIISMQ
ncbi:isocitrate/isopropylmalate dehydrogenase [Bacillus velezensis AS43.3]|nr:isocitrate/isopropylmalate dehydrogenase [Bacillus velezensis AS43.3]